MVIAWFPLLAAQSVVTMAPPISAPHPATEWSCDFLDSAGRSFQLKGRFAEAPAGTDPNADLPTVIEGNGPAELVGERGFNSFFSSDDARSYQVSTGANDGSRYNLSLLFARSERGLAFITRYVPDPATGRGLLSTFASGLCSSTFLKPGEGASRK